MALKEDALRPPGVALFDEDQGISAAVRIASKDLSGFAAGSWSCRRLLWRDGRRYRLCHNISSHPGLGNSLGTALFEGGAGLKRGFCACSSWAGWVRHSSGLCLMSSWARASSMASSSPCPPLPPPARPYSQSRMPKGTGSSTQLLPIAAWRIIWSLA